MGLQNRAGNRKSGNVYYKAEQLLNKVAENKRDSTQVFSCKYCEIFKNIFFEKHERTSASVHFKIQIHIQHPAVKYLRCFLEKLLVRRVTVQNTSPEKKAFRGVDKFLSRHLTFSVRNFTSTPDWTRKKQVVKTKVFVQSIHS